MTAFLAFPWDRATDSGRMAMISGGDESARNAFRAYLRDDALAAESSSQLLISPSTEEMSAGDVLEVKNLADAIERAERVLRESSRPRDMFAELGGDVPTDDASGPAVYARPTYTPVPPRAETTPIPPPIAPLPPPIIMVPNVPPQEEEAFLLQPRIRPRRRTATMVLGAILGALAVALGAGVVISCLPAKFEAKPAVITAGSEPKKDEAPSVPTMNVEDLPSAR
jgi:hypothetical protein